MEEHRYQQLIKALQYKSINKFAKEIGLPYSTLNQAITRGSGVTIFIVDKIVARFPHVNRDWLLTGQGDMFTTPTDTANEPPAPYGTQPENKGFFAWLLRQHDEYIKSRTLFTAEELEKMAAQRRKIEELKKKLDESE